MYKKYLIDLIVAATA